MMNGDFFILADAPPEEFVFGFIGKFWKLDDSEFVRLTNLEEFIHFNHPAYAKSAVNFFLVQETNRRVKVTTETRINVPDPTARREICALLEYRFDRRGVDQNFLVTDRQAPRRERDGLCCGRISPETAAYSCMLNEEKMLLDDFLPNYQFNEVHSIRVHAPIQRVYAAFKSLTPGELSPLVGIMFAIRALPGLITGKRDQGFNDRRPFLEQMTEGGFFILAEKAPQEIVFGLVGQFWVFTGAVNVKISSPEEFINFDNPEYAKTAANFLLVEEPNGYVRVTTETRVYVPGPAARRKFAFYWHVISMGSGLIRTFWLQAIKRRAGKRLASELMIPLPVLSTLYYLLFLP